jgi:hypothetical protein
MGGEMKNLVVVALLLLVGGIFQLPAVAEDNDAEKDVHYMGLLIGTGGIAGGASESIDIYVDAFTSAEEVMRLLNILNEKGQDGLASELERKDVGRIVTPMGPTNPGGNVNIAVARKFKSEAGSVVRLFTARPMSFLERNVGGRSLEHPFGLIELQLDKDGNGQGAVIVAAKVKITKEGRLELESLGGQYIKITNVRSVN